MRRSIFANSLVISISMMIMVFTNASMTGNALAYSMTTINSTTPANTSFLDNIEMKKVRVGDIDIAYKIFGRRTVIAHSRFFNDNGYVGSDWVRETIFKSYNNYF